MRRRLQENQYSKQAYFFGITSLILFLVQGALRWTKMVSDSNSDHNLPSFLAWVTLLLLFFTSVACIINAIRSRSETKNFKQMAGAVLAIGSLIFIIKVIIDTLSKA